MIHIHEELLSPEQSERLIYFYDKNSENSETYGGTERIFLKNHKDNSFLKEIAGRVDRLCKSLWLPPSYKIALQNAELVKWSEGSSRGEHIDNPEDVFAVIIYLNSDYEGGETKIGSSIVVEPEVGKGLIFSNSKYYHSVNEIKNGNRYVLCYWYINVAR